ncbi:MoaD/ThiS family protein [Streptosporangium lutulentum]
MRMATGLIRYWAAAKDAAGVAEESFEAATLAELTGKVTLGRDELARVMRRASFLVNGDPVGTRAHDTIVFADGATVEVLPPSRAADRWRPPCGAARREARTGDHRGPGREITGEAWREIDGEPVRRETRTGRSSREIGARGEAGGRPLGGKAGDYRGKSEEKVDRSDPSYAGKCYRRRGVSDKIARGCAAVAPRLNPQNEQGVRCASWSLS